MKKFVIGILFILPCVLNAQVLEREYTLSIQYDMVQYLGDCVEIIDDIETPALENNFYKSFALSVAAERRLNPFFSLGVQGRYYKVSDWYYPKSVLYQGDELTHFTFHPHAIVRIPYQDQGIFNRIQLSAQFGIPVSFVSHNSTSETLVVDTETGKVIDEENTYFYTNLGISVGAGLKIRIGKSWGLMTTCSVFQYLNKGLGTSSFLRESQLSFGFYYSFNPIFTFHP